MKTAPGKGLPRLRTRLNTSKEYVYRLTLMCPPEVPSSTLAAVKLEDLSKETLVEALEALPDGIAIYGPDSRPIYSNTATRRRFAALQADMDQGLTYREALSRALRRAKPDASEEKIERFADQLFSNFHSGATYSVLSDDSRVVQVTFRDISHGLKAAISVDVTDLQKRERDLQKANKTAEAANASKSSFLANMSHEIRTPLNGIMGMAQVLDATSLDSQQREFVSTILDSGKTLMSLLNDVLDLSKIEAGKFDIVPTDASLHHILRRQLQLWKPRAEEKGLELTLAFDADLPAYLHFDTVRVQQCVSNLVSNAIKFTASGRVEVFVSSKALLDGAHLVEIRVTDTGPGMDAETLARLFQPFAQADETIQRAHGGSGLGLSITRRLAELMAGSATATSEAGQGSIFRVSFRGGPARSQPEVGVDARLAGGDVKEQLKQSNLRVLLVDDNPINRQIVRLFLRPYNMRVIEAANGAEALEALSGETFDIVLLDMHMPVMDGPTTIHHIRNTREDWADIPVIALTADAMSGDRERYLAMGMTGYLSKPLAERDLLAEISRVRAERGSVERKWSAG
jgi:signal transduction histidine kinase/ActR/RegA family two-component response regulator